MSSKWKNEKIKSMSGLHAFTPKAKVINILLTKIDLSPELAYTLALITPLTI